MDDAQDTLRAAGMRPEEAASKRALWDAGELALDELGAAGGERSADRRRCFVPGRLEFLGKHTDYGGGRSLLCPVERGFCLTTQPREDDRVRLVHQQSGERVEFAIASALVPTVGHWSQYPMTVARRLAGNFDLAWRGVDIAIDSDLPRASGMSSSSALVVAMFLVLAERNRLDEHPLFREHLPEATDLAGYLGTIENGQSFGPLIGDKGVGTFGGSEDHTAILCGQPGRLSRFRFCPVVFEQSVALPDDLIFAIASSGVTAEKTGGALEHYNRVSNALRRIVECVEAGGGPTAAPSLAAILRDGPNTVEQVRQNIRDHAPPGDAQALIRRLEQFHGESERIIPAAADALRRGDLADLGRQIDESQRLAEQALGNQVDETIHLARAARRHGALAASAFGAGFGGSVWALLPRTDAETFLTRWRDDYVHAFPRRAPAATFFLTLPGPPALCLG